MHNKCATCRTVDVSVSNIWSLEFRSVFSTYSRKHVLIVKSNYIIMHATLRWLRTQDPCKENVFT